MKSLPRFSGVLLSLCAALVARATIGTTLQMQLGNPSTATADATNHTHYLSQRAQFAMDYNDTTREPNWVAWDLTSTDVGSSGRSNFIVDAILPASFYQVLTTDYSGSGYDRGHMCPSADRTLSTTDNQAVFVMSNMVPQTPDNNQGVWASFETYCRSLASAGNEILIISGPSGFAGSTIASGVAIPGYTWKIAVVVPLGSGTAVSRIDTSTRVIAIKIPNIAGIRSNPWQNYITSAAQIETDTGYTFFTALSSSIAAALRVKVDGQTATGAPTIVTQPTAQSAPVGGNASFSVSATGDAPLTYQWLKDDVEITNATNTTLALTNIQAADAATYTVVVSNAVGTTTSAGAALVVTGLAPTITSQPGSRTASAGTSATFAVSVSGTPPFTYQWRRGTVSLTNGGNVSGATAATLVLANVQSADAAADYNVVVTNSVTSTTSNNATLTVTPAAPTITSSPVAQTITTGSTLSLSVTAIGSAPLSYQWRKGGSPLSNGGSVSGATSATLTITNAQTTDSGSYDVVVSNGLAPDATSAAAAITVSAASAASTIYWDFAAATPTSGLPSDVTGGTVTQNNNNGTTTMITSTSASSGYTGASGGNNAGAAARTGALNTGASGSAYFEFTLTPAAGKQLATSALTFGARSTSTGPQAYDIYTSVDNYTTRIATGTLGADSVWRLISPTFSTLTGATGTSVTFRIYGYNGTGSAGTNTANWRIDDLKVTVNTLVAPPTAPAVVATTPANGATNAAITTPITVTFNQAVNVGAGWFSLSSAANGPLAATVTGGPTTYTLTPPASFSNGDTLTLTLIASQITDQATGALHPAANTVVSFTTLTPTAPSITTQPLAQTASAGGTVNFTVVATGTAPLAYQWRKGGVNITGNGSATTPTLSLTNVQAADAGSYDVVISNGVNPSATSTAVTLTVNPAAPTITTQPVATVATAGGTATFTVAVTGTSPFTYQWRKGGSAIVGNSSATTATLTLTNVQSTDAGSYDVVVSNGVNPAATSNAVALTVNPAPQSTLYWDFATVDPTSGVPAGLSAGSLTQNNNNGTTTVITSTSASSGYSGASGGNNAGAAARVGPLDKTAGTGSAYFEVVLTPATGQQVVVSSLGFGARSTGTGPQAYSVFTSLDNFASAIATGALSNNSVWTLITPSFAAFSGSGSSALTLRIYGHNGAGSASSGTANWRIDDLKIGVSLQAAPPPPPPPTIAATVTLGGLSATYDGTAKSVSVTTQPSGLTTSVTYNGIASAPTNAGSYAVVATVTAPGYTGSASATLVIAKASQTIAFNAPTNVIAGIPLSLTAIASSGLVPITFAVVSGNATLSGSSATFADTNPVTLRATQAGDGNYNAASAEITVSAHKEDQTITFLPLANLATTNAPFSISATASSNLGVTFQVISGPATSAGNTVTLTGAPGTVVIRATQSGNVTYNPAPPVERAFTVASPSFAGAYFGTLGSGGSCAFYIRPDRTGVFLGFSPGSATAYVALNVIVDERGQFQFSVNVPPATSNAEVPSRAAAELVFAGSISPNAALSGAATGNPSLTLAASRLAETGTTARFAGFYSAGTAGSSAQVLGIISPFGDAYVLTRSANTADAGIGSVDAFGRFTVTTVNRQQIAGSLSADDGSLTATVTDANGRATVFTGAAENAPALAAQRLLNLSTRARAGTAADAAIAGFVIAGTSPKEVLIRAVGPTLAGFGVSGPLAAPKLDLIRDGTVLSTNTGWTTAGNSAAIATAATRAGAFALGGTSADSALLVALAPGTYSAVVTAANNQPGVGLIEVYDLSAASAGQRLLNLSTRANAGTSAEALIAGVVIGGTAPKRVLIRAAGPALAPFGVSGVLARPQLALFSGSAILAQNTGWSTSADAPAIAEAATRTGAFAFGATSADSAILINLAPGNYTAQVTGVGNTTGVALVEIYEVP